MSKTEVGHAKQVKFCFWLCQMGFLGDTAVPPPPPPPPKNVNVESAIFPENYAEMDPQIIDSDSESSEQEKPVKIVEEELSDEPCQVCGRKDNLELVTTF